MPSCTALLYWAPLWFTRQNGPTNEGNDCVVFSFLLRLVRGKRWQVYQGAFSKDKTRKRREAVILAVVLLRTERTMQHVGRDRTKQRVPRLFDWEAKLENSLTGGGNVFFCYIYTITPLQNTHKPQKKTQHNCTLSGNHYKPQTDPLYQTGEHLHFQMLTRSMSLWHLQPDLFLRWIIKNKTWFWEKLRRKT